MHFDFFNTGLIGLLCLCKWTFVKEEILNTTKLNHNVSSIKLFNSFLDRCETQLLSKELNIYFKNIRMYCLSDLKSRKNSKFVQEKIILDEKHHDDSLW
jgi:hypothetical protein